MGWFFGNSEERIMEQKADLINRTTTDYLEYRDGAYYNKVKERG